MTDEVQIVNGPVPPIPTGSIIYSVTLQNGYPVTGPAGFPGTEPAEQEQQARPRPL